MSPRPNPSSSPVSARLIAAGTLLLTGTAWLGVDARYTGTSLVFLAVVYLTLSAGLVFGARWLTGWGRSGTLLAALGLAWSPLWQLRELTGQPERLVWLAAAMGLVAALLSPLLGRLRAEGRGWRDLGVALGLILLLAALVGIGYRSSNTLRWHLLRHNTLIGTPTYYLIERPVAERRAELFEDLARPRADRSSVPFTSPPSPTLDRAPHIVFLLLDTLRRDALAGWGGDPGQMPLLDRRLESAWRFTDLWAAATWTRPSMASFFTGLQPEAHGARGIDDALNRDHTTLAERLREQGYTTTAIVTNWGAVGEEAGFDQGFDTFRELRGEPYARAVSVNRALDSWLASPLAAEAIDQPQFLYLHFLDPHEPYLAGVDPGRRTAKDLRRAYLSELQDLDQQLDRAIESIERSLEGPTVFVLVSDHGEEFYEHELFGHGFSLYDEVLSLPLAVWGNELAGGGEIEAALEGRDLFELVLALSTDRTLAVDQWAAEHARSSRYASIYYSSEGRLTLRPYISQVTMRAVQERSEKLIWSAYGDTWELYDLTEDPGETVNLATRRPERVEQLRGLLDRAVDDWRAATPLVASDETLEQMRALGYVDN